MLGVKNTEHVNVTEGKKNQSASKKGQDWGGKDMGQKAAERDGERGTGLGLEEAKYFSDI